MASSSSALRYHNHLQHQQQQQHAMPPHQQHSAYYGQQHQQQHHTHSRMAPRYSAADSWGMGAHSVSATRLPVPAASSAAPLVSMTSSSTTAPSASSAHYYAASMPAAAGVSASSGYGAGALRSSTSSLVADLAAWPSSSSLGDAYFGSASPIPASRTVAGLASLDDYFVDPALQFAVQADPFSAAEDAVFCPLPLSTIAEDHGVPEDHMKRLAVAMLSPDLSAVAYLGPPRTPSPHSSRSSSRGSLSSEAALSRSRAWSSSSSEPDNLMMARSSPTPTAPVARRPAAAIKIVDPSTRQAIDLRSAVRSRRH